MARQRPDDPAVEQKRHLLISRSAVESSERPTVPARRDRPEAIRGIPDERTTKCRWTVADS